MMIGMKVDVDPIPPIPENTRVIDAGAVRFGVEYRMLDEKFMGEHYGAAVLQSLHDATELAIPAQIDDSGVSIHVFGDDGCEYLRFDCFVEEPHYHYVLPREPHQRVVPFDPVANGDPLSWALSCLRTRFVPMMREAGGGDAAARADLGHVRRALDQVERLARAIVKDNLTTH
jgi:hypothetical protein